MNHGKRLRSHILPLGYSVGKIPEAALDTVAAFFVPLVGANRLVISQ